MVFSGEVMRVRFSTSAKLLLLANLVLMGGQAAYGKLAALHQGGDDLHLVFLNPYYLILLFCLFARAVLWPMVLQRVPLGFAYAFTTLSYLVTLGLSVVMFNEEITVQNLLGVGLIVIGLCIWSYDTQEHEELP